MGIIRDTAARPCCKLRPMSHSAHPNAVQCIVLDSTVLPLPCGIPSGDYWMLLAILRVRAQRKFRRLAAKVSTIPQRLFLYFRKSHLHPISCSMIFKYIKELIEACTLSVPSIDPFSTLDHTIILLLIQRRQHTHIPNHGPRTRKSRFCYWC